MDYVEPITSFRGGYSFLSNMHRCKIVFKRFTFPSVENAYQAMKFVDDKDWTKFLHCSPKQAKGVGQSAKLNANWKHDKLGFMILFVDKKFNDPILGKKLLDTGNAKIIEGNNWNDKFWGQCPIGQGRNELGKILMDKRESLRIGL